MADDWMDESHRAAALSGFRSNPVAVAYARACSRSPETADGMLRRVKRDVTLLPLAPLEAQGSDIERRREGVMRRCFRCERPADVAYIVDSVPVLPRWLDLCNEDAMWLVTSATWM